MNKQKTIELSVGDSSIEIVDNHHMIIKAQKIIIDGQVKFQCQQILD